LQTNWNIWIDTGGTFTDCLAYDVDDNLQRIKVLSSARLRGSIKSSNDYILHVSISWPVLEDIFVGYQLKIDQQVDNFYKVVSTNLANGEIRIDRKIKGVKNLGFEIFSGEEAPILATRLATKTPLSEQLPNLKMRLGSTKGTNSLLERKGAKVLFLVSKGMKDLVEIGTQQRPDLFSVNVKKHSPLYDRVYEIDERIDASGDVMTQMDEKTISTIVDKIAKSDFDAIAIAFMNSYQNSVHEDVLQQRLQTGGIPYISTSSSIAKEIGILARAQTAIVNAYLSPVIHQYLEGIKSKLQDGALKVMTSAGGLVDVELFNPKDSLLSGPAGGVIGAAKVAQEHGFHKMLTFDMGGTSTDVSRYEGKPDYNFISEISNIPIYTPSVAIETVAAGGGSICDFKRNKLQVGPESAGAMPGPACYGNNGPLTITDVNLLLGRIDTANFSIPIDLNASKARFAELKQRMSSEVPDEDVLSGFIQIANEKMAEAIRKISLSKGYDPSEHLLLAFGGAGGQHACRVAEILEAEKILVPYNAGLLSAYGIGHAEIERFTNRQLLQPLDEAEHQLPEIFDEMEDEAISLLKEEGVHVRNIYHRNSFVYMRLQGQESTIEIEYSNSLRQDFKKAYEKLFGHWVDNISVEVESIRLIMASNEESRQKSKESTDSYDAIPYGNIRAFVSTAWQQVPTYIWEDLGCGARFSGPAVLMSNNSTVFVESNWDLRLHSDRDAIITRRSSKREDRNDESKIADLELFTNRFKSVADDMGAILQRTAFSVNVKDRMDFSCAVLDSNGYLVANAPHIPVHLGSLGVCTRRIMETLELQEGDVVVTNHPAYGGSHLPDITLLAPVFHKHKLIAFVANRAHHAEIGGKTPGSMPADATNLEEEGVVVKPIHLVKNHIANWDEVIELLTQSKYPTRALEENLADLNGALASINIGIEGILKLCDQFGAETVRRNMRSLLDYSGEALLATFQKLENSVWSATEFLDDGNQIKVEIVKNDSEIVFDFTGTSDVHPGNLNANLAILNSAVIYVLRLMLEEALPLNEGIMQHVKIHVPSCMLNPRFDENPARSPAVVGGNTETSQRIVDTLIKALRLSACSQGTMNNLIFGNDHFGFYETIGGGVGACKGFDGADAVHQHMTNTKITDPELLEFRYPVVLEKFEIREKSGGKGKWRGGNGIVRQLRFREEVVLTILSQHRNEKPYGMEQGQSGKTGKQVLMKASGEIIEMKGIDTVKAKKNDVVRIETPGGGGYGKSDAQF